MAKHISLGRELTLCLVHGRISTSMGYWFSLECHAIICWSASIKVSRIPNQAKGSDSDQRTWESKSLFCLFVLSPKIEQNEESKPPDVVSGTDAVLFSLPRHIHNALCWKTLGWCHWMFPRTQFLRPGSFKPKQIMEKEGFDPWTRRRQIYRVRCWAWSLLLLFQNIQVSLSDGNWNQLIYHGV